MRYLNQNWSAEEYMKFPDKYDEEWNRQYSQYMEEFNKIIHRFPKAFISEYSKHHMHDYIITSILLERKVLKNKYKYELNIHLVDYYDENIEHLLTFLDVDHLKTDLLFDFAGNCDWIYNEFLAVNSKRLSFEVVLFSDSVLYCEFSKLRYKKIRRKL